MCSHGALFALVALVRERGRQVFHGMAAADIMTSIWEKTNVAWRQVVGLLRHRRETGPIDSVARLQEFTATRSAYVAQKTLYGYIKTRMGTRYPAMFEGGQVVDSLNIAKWHVFAACLSDLTIFAVGAGLNNQPVGNDERQAMALVCYQAGLRDSAGDAPEKFSAQDYVDEFKTRLTKTDWRLGALTPENFNYSPRALVRWAPIADNLKKFDAEIVMNSVKFSWRDVREQLLKRIDGAAICADWLRQGTDVAG